jgi:hypothetical protein
MSSFRKRTFIPNPVYYIMSEHPNCCPNCQCRLDILETVQIENEEIQVNYCEHCGKKILMIDEDVSTWIS